MLSFLLRPRVTVLFPQTNEPAHGEDTPTKLWDQGGHCSAQEALTTPQAQGKLWLLFLNPWQTPWRAQPTCFVCQIEVSFTCCCWNSPANHNPRTVLFPLKTGWGLVWVFCLFGQFFPCDHFMELIYEPCSLDRTFPNYNRLISRSSCYSCFTVLHEQPRKQSLCGGKEQCLGTESVSWGRGGTPASKEAPVWPC